MLAAEPGDWLLVAEGAGQEIVGYALGRRLIDEAHDAELVSLHVRNDAQGQGIGPKLMSAVAEHLHRQGCRTLVVWTLTANLLARDFYERLGGQLTGQREIELGDAAYFQEVAYGWPNIESIASMQRFDD